MIGTAKAVKTPKKPGVRFRKAISKYWQLYLLMLPGLLYFLVFKYLPMYGIVIAFENYFPWLGIFKSEWVGFENFTQFFTTKFFVLLKNTMLISSLKMITGFFAPIILALMLNEVRFKRYKRTVQTISYMPYFLSWVIVYGIMYNLFNTTSGAVNFMIEQLGGNSVAVLSEAKYFIPMVVLTGLWKGVGYGSIIYLAALTSIDPQYYESAMLDGANKWKQLIHITLPGISSTIAVMFLLGLGGVLYSDFQQLIVFLGENALLWEVGDVFETHVFRVGLLEMNYSYGTVVGLFQSVIGLILVVFANRGAKRFGYRGVF